MTGGITGDAIIVTGGAGFVGSHVCKALSKAGYVPVTVDNLSTGHADAVKWGPLERVDLRATDALARVLRRYGSRMVIHLAASAYVGESVVDPALYYDNNVGGMISLLAACRATQTDKIVLSSSCATYGIPAEVPITESTQQRPINPYGRTKLICEEMIRDHATAYGLRYAFLRYFNACGADPEGELSERHDPETHLIPLALMAAAGSRPALNVFGVDYDTPDGTCVRDYIHVSDLAQAHLLALRRLEAGKEDILVNLGSGEGLSILQIASAIRRVTGRDLPWVAAPRRAGDPPTLIADTAQAQRLLQFSPQRSVIDTIIRDAAQAFGLEAMNEQYA
jgi:UDP-arabinose 4-epimerase